MKVHNILIVDDDEMITTTLSKVVSIMLKQTVMVFNDPVLALETIEKNEIKVDLVISDFIMPDINGIEFLKRLKKIRPNTVSILLTGYSDKQNAIASINEIGIFHYMEKPWDNDDLIRVIMNGLDKKRLTDDLKEKVIELENRNLEIKDLYSRLEEEYKKETERNITLEATVAERTSSIRNLLDNAGQGFLSFGTDLLIDQGFSAQCRNIFGKHVRDTNFVELIYPEDKDQQNYVKSLAEKVIMAESDEIQALYLPLLPDYIEINNLSIYITYKVIKRDIFFHDKILMAILTDVTEKHELESQVVQERNLFMMVVKIVTEPQNFSICVAEFLDFMRSGVEDIIMRNDQSSQALNELFRRVHTMKGNFSMINMTETVICLHEAEDHITLLQDYKEPIDKDELLFAVNAIDFKSGFDKDILSIKKILGETYFQPDNLIRIDRATIVDLEGKMAHLLNAHEFMALVPFVRKMGFKKIGDLFSSFLDYMMTLSELYGKMLEPIKISGGDIRIDPDVYSPFVRSLIHVFRNSVVHGIEEPEVRVLKGKTTSGTIFCEIICDNDQLEIIIGDDGKGIDLEAVKGKALQKGMISLTESDLLNDHETALMIFNDSLSTVDSVDLQHGRGVGLSAVREELLKLKGSVEIITEKDNGVCFHFRLPLQQTYAMPPLSHTDIIEPVAGFAAKVIGEYLEDGVSQIGPVEKVEQHQFMMHENTIFIAISGQIEGTFFVSFDKALADAIMLHCDIECSEVERYTLVTQALSEITNIILGNCMGEFKQWGDFIIIDTPYVLNAQNARMEYPCSDIILCHITFNFGNCCVGVINKG